MPTSGAIFAPVAVEAPAQATSDDMAFPTETPLKLSSEEMAKGTVAIGAAAGVDVDALPGAAADAVSSDAALAAAASAAPPASAATPAPAFGVPSPTIWPVRLLSTVAQAQPPRAILGLPDGSETVVSPGSMLAAQGLVVMTVTPDHVQLARIQPAGDHAAIDTIELSAQYPGK
jgi:hypothetical protein